jgi:hypothetical protein
MITISLRVRLKVASHRIVHALAQGLPWIFATYFMEHLHK